MKNLAGKGKVSQRTSIKVFIELDEEGKQAFENLKCSLQNAVE